ncbi:MAG: ATP-binding cassette domain-containing protein [Kineosporiaceae bacterium]|nr:ATP-binding cassette domain-containing protein [Kineosporiaceae bacterium]
MSLRVQPGEVVLVVGPSGGGKTTALLSMGLLLTPSSGTVNHSGVETRAMTERQRSRQRLLGIGFVFQQFNLLEALTALENVTLPLRYAGVRTAPATARATRLLDDLGLAHRATSRPRELSGGEKQRVAVARALALAPRLILADEPTANLDSASGHQVAEHLVRAARHQRSGVVVVTHDTRLADAADRVLLLEDGRLRESSPSDPAGTRR